MLHSSALMSFNIWNLLTTCLAFRSLKNNQCLAWKSLEIYDPKGKKHQFLGGNEKVFPLSYIKQVKKACQEKFNQNILLIK
jgi:hypothetical protein